MSLARNVIVVEVLNIECASRLPAALKCERGLQNHCIWQGEVMNTSSPWRVTFVVCWLVIWSRAFILLTSRFLHFGSIWGTKPLLQRWHRLFPYYRDLVMQGTNCGKAEEESQSKHFNV